MANASIRCPRDQGGGAANRRLVAISARRCPVFFRTCFVLARRGLAAARRVLVAPRRPRWATLAAFAAPLLAAVALVGVLDSVRKWVLFLIGFGAVIFFHELGHFLTAKFFKIRCDVFALGIGPRLCGWRKGVGFSVGPTPIGPVPPSAPEAGAAPTRKIGETDYRLSWFPFGGYVRMLGQDDLDARKVSDDPASFGGKTIWQRMIVIASGVTMNLIFAAILFAVIFRVGVRFPPAVVGGVIYGSPAQQAGLRTGDRIISVNHHPPLGFLEFTDLATASALDSPGQPVSLQYLRGRSARVYSVNVTPRPASATGLLTFGILSPVSLRIAPLTPAGRRQLRQVYPAWKGVGAGAVIRRIDGHPVRNYGQLDYWIQRSGGRPVRLEFSSARHGQRVITLQPTLAPRPGVTHWPAILGMYPLVRVQSVLPGDPAAAAGIKTGDRIIQIGALRYPNIHTLRAFLLAHGGALVPITVRRGDHTVLCHARLVDRHGSGFLGIALGYDFLRPQVGAVTTAAAKLGIHSGAILTALNLGGPNGPSVPIHDWFQLVKHLRRAHGDQITLAFAGAAPPVSLRLTRRLVAPLKRIEYVLDLPLEPLLRLQRTRSWTGAVVMGLDHTWRWILRTYLTLRGIGVGTISPHQLHSVLVIAKLGYEVQSRGFTYLLFFLGVISVNLAVINFLPLPILDGGLFLLLLLEKIRGRPLPLKLQSAIQIAGIALLGALFLYITVFNDLPMLLR